MRGMHYKPLQQLLGIKLKSFSAWIDRKGLLLQVPNLFRGAELQTRTMIQGMLCAGTRLRSWRGPCNFP